MEIKVGNINRIDCILESTYLFPSVRDDDDEHHDDQEKEDKYGLYAQYGKGEEVTENKGTSIPS